MDSTQQSPASLASRIRDAGLRATEARVSVLAVFDAASGPLTHAAALGVLAEGLDRATVYRNLADLSEAGLLRRVDLGGTVQHYEAVWKGGPSSDHAGLPHPHFVCVDCGNVRCLDDLKVTLSGTALDASLARAAVSVRLSGQCDACS